jgi:predicted phage terminase large subunit-like protein
MSRTKQPPRAVSQLRPDQIRIELPDLHDLQERVLRHPARHKVVVCGRQWGKTTLGAVMAIAEAARGGHVWWVAPSYPIGELAWSIIDWLCRQIPGTRFEGRPVYRITLPTGGTIQLRSADNPDSLRGATLDGVVFDEAAQAKPEAWPYLQPTLAVRQGWALFISTPKGLNWFYDLYQLAGESEAWERWSFPTSSNPYMPPGEVDRQRQEMSSLLFAQEYLAEFISTATGMFRSEWIQHYQSRMVGDERLYVLGTESIADERCRKFHTVDLAWSLDEGADYTVISSWALTPQKHLLLLDMIRGHFEGPDIVPKLRQAYQRFGGVLVVERATRQMSIIQEAVRTGLPVREIKADKDKIARALPATARMEQGRVWFPPATVPWFREIEEEMLAFPAGRHDDFVDTLAYAVAEGSGGPTIHVWKGPS